MKVSFIIALFSAVLAVPKGPKDDCNSCDLSCEYAHECRITYFGKNKCSKDCVFNKDLCSTDCNLNCGKKQSCYLQDQGDDQCPVEACSEGGHHGGGGHGDNCDLNCGNGYECQFVGKGKNKSKQCVFNRDLCSTDCNLNCGKKQSCVLQDRGDNQCPAEVCSGKH